MTYDIAKKASQAPFSGQPSWRSQRHSVTDVRFGENTPTTFYVFARSPDLSAAIFENFLDALQFSNDFQYEETGAFFAAPIENPAMRVTKKPFGIRIDPATSPVQPERFRGYHTGIDFEVSREEREIDVDVFAICDGEIMDVRTVSGYGGVITQVCERDGEELHILYGHVSVARAEVTSGQDVTAGTVLTVLGAHESSETDGERKHLHLGISSAPDVRGYVSVESELSLWQDYFDVVQ